MENRYNPDVLNCIANLSNDEVFTPPSLANQLLDLLPSGLFESPETKFLDPFTKSGVFLREIVKRLDKGLESVIPDRQKRINHIMHNQVYGIACTELTSLLARRSVYCSKTASGKHSVTKFETPEGNILYKPLSHTWEGGKCIYCGASQAVYDRGSQAEQYAYQFIHTDKPAKIFGNMKFDVIIGNPPYQLADGGNGASAKPIYHLFVEQAMKLTPRFLSMIIPARWFAGGKGLDDFRAHMLNDSHILHITDYINAKDCFPNNSISGGVCFFLWDRESVGQCHYTTILNGEKSEQIRQLNEFSVFVRYNNAISVIHKIKSNDFVPISSIILSRNPFGITSSIRGEKEKFKFAYELNSSKGIGYIENDRIIVNKSYADAYNVMISKVTCEHAGEPDKNGQVKILSSLKILPPKSVCTDSYLIIGKFNNIEMASNLEGYLKTKFARFLLLQAVSSINLSKDKFQFVPLQDFSHPWTDEMLYEKYKLTQEEIEFIESMIRPME